MVRGGGDVVQVGAVIARYDVGGDAADAHLHRPLLRHQAHLLHLSQLQNLPRRQKWLLQPWRLLTMHLREKDLPAVSIRLLFGALPKKRASA